MHSQSFSEDIVIFFFYIFFWTSPQPGLCQAGHWIFYAVQTVHVQLTDEAECAAGRGLHLGGLAIGKGHKQI